MEPEHLMCGVLGAFFGALLMIVLIPDHKANCDQFGATSFGQKVYECQPKAK